MVMSSSPRAQEQQFVHHTLLWTDALSRGSPAPGGGGGYVKHSNNNQEDNVSTE